MKLNASSGVNLEESDGEMSGAESERSNSSREQDGARESSEEGTSDESSDMDETECEIRRTDCLDNITDLERQFNVLREQLYRERISQVDHQLVEVKLYVFGTFPNTT